MASLIVRNLEKEVVQKLREEAARHGVSMEEHHRRILRKTLTPSKRKFSRKENLKFGEFLIAPPYFDDDLVKSITTRKRDKARPVNLE